MADLPPLIPVPPPAVRSTLQPEDWDACVDAWITLLGILLEASGDQFAALALKDGSTAAFLASFYHEQASSSVFGADPTSKRLRKFCFLLTRRLLVETPTPPSELLDWKFLAELCCCYPSSSPLKSLLSTLWEKHESTITTSLDKAKAHIIKQLAFGNPSNNQGVSADIRLLTILTSALPPSGQLLVTGSDFLDTLFDAYQTQKREPLRPILVANAYVGLTSLLKGSTPNLSLLLDHLFSLKAAAGVGSPNTKKEPTLLSDLICSSDILGRLERYLSVNPQKRGEDLVSSLRSYQSESKIFHHRYQKQRRKLDKGKTRAGDTSGAEELHAHKLSLVTQIQDLFPDLGSGYIVRLLDHYGDNTETVVAHLLDESLPPELQFLDKSEQLPSINTITTDPLPPKGTPPEIPSPTPQPQQPARKNIFDNDIDIAELARSPDPTTTTGAHGKLHFGRVDPDATADTVLADRSHHATNKAAILSALATFDSDDDERDDTYDVADVGGTVDAMVPSSTEAEAGANAHNAAAADQADFSLFRTYRSNPGLFGRDAATRRSQPRASLKRETGMTDEAIEGWAVMLNRDPKRIAKLEDRLALEAGGAAGGGLAQPELPSTSYRKPTAAEKEEESGDEREQPSSSRGRGGGFRGRGRGRGRGGRGGGGGGGPPPDPNSAISRQRKEENKASRANHNRRQQRAKKIARGGGLPG